MLQKVVVIDGFPGCGKTMLSPIVSAFDRVEMMQYAPVIEQMCELWNLKRIDDDVAESMIKMNADLLIYNIMMGRNSNCRPTDLSSIFNHRPLEHIKRMLELGDKLVPGIIEEKNPILHLTTHMLFPATKLLFSALGERLTFIEVVRHPLYMIIQQEKNFDMFEGPCNNHVRYTTGNKEYTFFTQGWEKLFNASNSFEKAIYSIEWYSKKLFSYAHNNFVTIPFERFVKEPDGYIATLTSSLDVEFTQSISDEMQRQKVPRKILADGPSLDIYKRCGWKPPTSNSEEEELAIRRELVASNVSTEALAILDRLSTVYTNSFMVGDI